MAHRRGFSGRGGRGISDSQRRKKTWESMDNSFLGTEDVIGTQLLPPGLIAAGESASILAFSTADNPSFAESTILRIRGYVDVPKSTTDTGVAFQTAFAFGIGIVTEQAADSVIGIPNPATITGQDWDGWLFLRSSNQIALDITGTMLDVKAMRKWKGGESIVLVAGFAMAKVAGDTTQPFSMSMRGLFLKP